MQAFYKGIPDPCSSLHGIWCCCWKPEIFPVAMIWRSSAKTVALISFMMWGIRTQRRIASLACLRKYGVSSAPIDYLKVWDVFNNRLGEVDSTLENLINTEKGPKWCNASPLFRLAAGVSYGWQKKKITLNFIVSWNEREPHSWRWWPHILSMLLSDWSFSKKLSFKCKHCKLCSWTQIRRLSLLVPVQIGLNTEVYLTLRSPGSTDGRRCVFISDCPPWRFPDGICIFLAYTPWFSY